MEFVTLPELSTPVSRVGLGGCPLGGHGWGPVDQRDLENAIRAAVGGGVNFFDTADIYGLGQSEQILSEVLGKAALTQQAAGQARDAANSWGHFLVYIRQLVSAKTELPESWLTQQEILAETITQWNEERWQKFPPEILKELPNAWPHAAETYQAAKAE